MMMQQISACLFAHDDRVSRNVCASWKPCSHARGSTMCGSTVCSFHDTLERDLMTKPHLASLHLCSCRFQLQASHGLGCTCKCAAVQVHIMRHRCLQAPIGAAAPMLTLHLETCFTIIYAAQAIHSMVHHQRDLRNNMPHDTQPGRGGGTSKTTTDANRPFSKESMAC
jgi:hypothetical protein